MSMTTPDTITDLLPTMRQIATDAEARAARFRDFVTLLEETDPDALDEQIGSRFSGPSWVREVFERVDTTAHIHSGSSDASRVRMFQSALLGLLSTLQRENR